MPMPDAVEAENAIESFPKFHVQKGVEKWIDCGIQPEEPEGDLVDQSRDALVGILTQSADQRQECVRTPADREDEDEDEEILRRFTIAGQGG